MKGVVLVTGDDALRQEAEAYFTGLGMEFSNELPVERVPDWALVADLGMLAPLASGLPNQDLGKIFGLVVALSAAGGFHARMQAVRLGASAFLERPVTAAGMYDLLEKTGALCDDEPLRILIVDDDPIVARVTGRQLEMAGMRIMTVEDPSKALDGICEFRPDLAILDLYMPQCSGTELAQVIRQIPRFEILPIIFLSSEGELAAQMNAVSAGGDDFVAKGTPAALMIPLIRSRAARMRKVSRHPGLDALTRLPSPGGFHTILEDGLAAAAREGAPFSLALLEIEGLGAINARHGCKAGDEVVAALARLLRHRLAVVGGQAGRLGGPRFGAVLPLAGADAEAQIDMLRTAFSSLCLSGRDGGGFRVSFRTGLAEAEPGESAVQLISRAEEKVV